MEEEKKKKRGWVKDAAIIFLAVLLVLTFFSNTILNRSLPEVATVYVQEGTITNKVRGTGTVTARENYDVTIDQTRKVQSVLVRVGDEVSVGDVLFTLQPGDSDELENAEKKLKSLEESYQLWLLDLTTADYFDLDRSISDAREALVEAREDRDKAEITADDLREYEEKLAELEAKQAELEAAIESQQAVVDAGSESVDELGDRSGTLRELELQMRRLKDEQHEQELMIRGKEEALQAANDNADATKAEKQKAVDEAKERLDQIEKEINEEFGMGSHQDADYEPVRRAKEVYDAAIEEAEAATEEYLTTRVLYGEAYDNLVQEAIYMEYDNQVYAIQKDTELKYRTDKNIDRDTELTPDQKTEIEELAQPEVINSLGKRSEYKAKNLSVYLPAAAEKNAGTDMAIAYDKINAAKSKVDAKEEAQRNAREAYNDAYADYKEKKEDDDEFKALDSERERAQNLLNRAEAAMEKAMEPMNEAIETADQALKAAKRAKTDIDNAIADLQYKINQITNEDLADRKTDLSEADQKLKDLQADLDKAKADHDKLEADMEARENEFKQAKEKVKNAERNLEDRLRDLEKQKKNDGKQQMRDSISQRDKLEEIEEQRALVEELSSADNGTEVRANVSGKIQSLSVSAGHKAEAGNVLATIEVPDLGYGMSFTVTTEQARRLKVGDSATVSNFYWGSQIVATLASIQTDPQNPQGSRILNFDVTGDVTAGNSLTISVGEKNANYDMVVPNSAVRSDTNGSFVLMVTAKNSPLGNRYFASRVNVEVVASDDQYSAISGAIEPYDSVITTASRNAPISSGDQVRLADSNNG